MIIKHTVTKKLETGWKRHVFQCINDTNADFSGEFFLELKALLGAVFNAHQVIQLKKGAVKYFTIDLEDKNASRWSKFKCSFSYATRLDTYKGKKVEKYENLTDVVIQNNINTNKQINSLKWW
ncbi:hypothetical protein [Flectobacillus roseus]|uniref:hypothetical protein n=1 Tax=Flectobacillus roseus TaxID=502259 RepID=UPI0024B6A73D|nr:hypothetical protein [Flectobacillus roseus]MDI9871321.1 hypothetical protein [Flectobacillus roseus]